MDISYYKNMEPLFGEWRIKRLIGEGNFGKVFEIIREDFGRQYTAAMKVITIPQSESEVKSVMADGMDSKSVTAYYRGFVEEIVDEFALMSKLKGNSNIVSYEDHKVIEHKDGFGWDILIRMELLTPLLDHIAAQSMTRRDIVQLGIDMCRALEFCQKHNIIHRDIKPENIFVSENGDYKLGDFGIARTVEKTTSGLSKKGTYTYMAPEVYRGEPYGAGVDLYSLGLVLFRLLNNNRAPFLPPYPDPMSFTDREAALSKRINGEKIPRPVNADEQVCAIIQKACAFQSKDRYASPSEMRVALEDVLEQQDNTEGICHNEAYSPANTGSHATASGKNIAEDRNDRTESVFSPRSQVIEDSLDNNDKTESAFSARTAKKEATQSAPKQTKNTEKKKSGFAKIALGGLVALAAIVLVITLFSGGNEPGKTSPGPALSVGTNNDSIGTGEQTEQSGTDAEVPPLDKTFDSLLWGSYNINDYVENEKGTLEQDYTGFLKSMKFEDIAFSDGTVRNVSVVPWRIDVDENGLVNRISPSDLNEVRNQLIDAVGAVEGEQLYQNYLNFANTSIITFWYRDKTNTGYHMTYVYEIEGNTLSYGAFSFDEDTYELTPVSKDQWMKCEFHFEGRNLILERGGRDVELVPALFDDAAVAGEYGQYMHGCVAKDEDAYQSISSIYYTGGTNHEFCSIGFTDGHYAIDPVIELGGENTITISWQERWVEYDGRTERVSDPTTITAEYISCGDYGLILIADGKYYKYQSTDDQYLETKLADNLDGTDITDMSDADVQTLVQRQSSILKELDNAFEVAGVEANIDETSGKVTMDASILFELDDATLSDVGQAYLDGFLDVYSSVILSDAYKGFVSNILVEGHTDTSGGYDYNMTLSKQRAQSVVDYCLGRQPELADVITARGCSWDNPVYDENGEVDMDASRRVIFKFILNTDF